MTRKPTGPSNQNSPRPDVNLDSRYGAIGISAVAAALQFKREAKKAAAASQSRDGQPPGFTA